MSIEFNHPVYDEGAAWQEESWSAHGGQSAPWHLPMEVDRCVYVDGKHVYAGPDCPHDRPEDFDPGWTVQQRG
jgi:hypothetical protein